MAQDWNNRPAGCKATTSGKHIPRQRFVGVGQIELYCEGCGKVDDTGAFSKWFGFGKKIDDSKPKQCQ